MFQEHTVRKIQLSLKKKRTLQKLYSEISTRSKALYLLSELQSIPPFFVVNQSFLSPDQRGCLECRKVISFASRLRLHDCRLKINSRHFLIQSEVKQNQLRRARTSFPALFGSYMLLLQRFDWFTGLSALFVIGLHVW